MSSESEACNLDLRGRVHRSSVSGYGIHCCKQGVPLEAKGIYLHAEAS